MLRARAGNLLRHHRHDEHCIGHGVLGDWALLGDVGAGGRGSDVQARPSLTSTPLFCLESPALAQVPGVGRAGVHKVLGHALRDCARNIRVWAVDGVAGGVVGCVTCDAYVRVTCDTYVRVTCGTYVRVTCDAYVRVTCDAYVRVTCDTYVRVTCDT